MPEARAVAIDPPLAVEREAMPPPSDWIVRPFAAEGRRPAPFALGLFLAFVASSWAFRLAVETPSIDAFLSSPYTYLDLANALLFVYLVLALHVVRRGRLRDLEELRPLLDVGDEAFAVLARETVDAPAGRLFAAGFVGATALGSMPVVDASFWAGSPPPLLSLDMVFFTARSALLGWVAGHVVLTDAYCSNAFRRLGAERVRVDLLDPTPLAVFARPGLRTAMTWVLASSLISLFWLGPAAARTNAIAIGVILVSVVVGFVFSMTGVRANIRTTKRRALDDLARALRRRGLRGASSSGEPSLADLISLHGFVERVREWPLGASTVSRAALIALLALGSWGGSAAVELLMERMFGG